MPATYPTEAKHLALRYILDAWEEAVYEGLEPDCIATAAIFAALSDMVATYGEEPVAVMCAKTAGTHPGRRILHRADQAIISRKPSRAAGSRRRPPKFLTSG